MQVETKDEADHDDTKQSFQNSVYIKNLNFETTEKTIQEFLDQKQVKGIKNITVVRKSG